LVTGGDDLSGLTEKLVNAATSLDDSAQADLAITVETDTLLVGLAN